MKLNFEELVDIKGYQQEVTEKCQTICKKFVSTGDEAGYYVAISDFFIEKTEAIFDYACKKSFEIQRQPLSQIKAVVDGIKNNFLQFYRSKIWNDWQGGGKNDPLMTRACERFEERFHKALDDKKIFFIAEHKGAKREKWFNRITLFFTAIPVIITLLLWCFRHSILKLMSAFFSHG